MDVNSYSCCSIPQRKEAQADSQHATMAVLDEGLLSLRMVDGVLDETCREVHCVLEAMVWS